MAAPELKIRDFKLSTPVAEQLPVGRESRSDATSLATIAITFLTSGAAAALINAIAAAIRDARREAPRVTITKQDGTTITLDARVLTPDEIKKWTISLGSGRSA